MWTWFFQSKNFLLAADQFSTSQHTTVHVSVLNSHVNLRQGTQWVVGPFLTYEPLFIQAEWQLSSALAAH